MKIIIIFIILSALNVVLSTVKSLVTIKGGKTMAALSNAIYYAFYTVVLIYIVGDFPLWIKVVVTGLCNFVGVFIVKLVEEKTSKDKLWKIEVTVPDKYVSEIDEDLVEIPHSYILVGRHALFNFYCRTKTETKLVKDYCEGCEGKFFAAESKNLW